MRHLLEAIRLLAGWQKLIVGLMVALVVLTWLAVCSILAGYLL